MNKICKHKWDIIIILAAIFIAGISWFVFNNRGNVGGNYVQIIVDGTITDNYLLSENGEFEINNGEHRNILYIADGKAYMKDADCPDRLCISQGIISKNGQSIICLPNRIVVKIISDIEDEVDAYAQ